MPSEGRWTTWVRPHHRSGTEQIITRESEQKAPMGFSQSRPATDDEIAAELERRKQKVLYAQRQKDFQDRPDYQDAAAIRNILEWMTPEKHPLDALSPEEWTELRKRLEVPNA